MRVGREGLWWLCKCGERGHGGLCRWSKIGHEVVPREVMGAVQMGREGARGWGKRGNDT